MKSTHIFRSRTEAIIRDYLDLEQAGIVIYNYALITMPKANWLSINPLLAEDMDLKFNSEVGNFRWDNEQKQYNTYIDENDKKFNISPFQL